MVVLVRDSSASSSCNTSIGVLQASNFIDELGFAELETQDELSGRSDMGTVRSRGFFTASMAASNSSSIEKHGFDSEKGWELTYPPEPMPRKTSNSARASSIGFLVANSSFVGDTIFSTIGGDTELSAEVQGKSSNTAWVRGRFRMLVVEVVRVEKVVFILWVLVVWSEDGGNFYK